MDTKQNQNQNNICINFIKKFETCTLSKNIIFLLRISFVFFSEIIMYFFMFRRYNDCIKSIIHKLANQNILYVKIFQALALNNDFGFINDETCFLKFADNAPWSDSDIDYNTLRQIELDQCITIENNFQPINSGMISLVFKGFRNNNSKEFVVIKMKRNNIENMLNDGIEKLLFCIYLSSFIPIVNNYRISEVIHKNIDLIRYQTNFSLEIQQMQQMKHNCRRLKYITIPQGFPEVTEKWPNAIMMEYIQGKTIKDVDPDDNEIFAVLVLKFVFVTLFMNSCCHGDLHTGNILFIKESESESESESKSKSKNKYKICILDFGIIYKMDKINDALFYIFSNMGVIPSREIAENTLTSGIIEPVDNITKLPKHHYDNLIQILSDFINDTVHVSGKLNQTNIFKVFFNLNEYLISNNLINNKISENNCNLYASDDFVKFQMILTMLHGVILKLCKNRYIELANQVMTETFKLAF
jgi:predicted unusual protein kinase regulating ubiquinone biosynthesis (AarF/ABC1/UbiB family)